MTRKRNSLHNLRKDKRAISPAISTVILTSAVVVLLIVTIVFANNFLDMRLAENEFSAMEQFMQTVGLQIDDVAWIIGRTQTVTYASKYGQVSFESETLVYSFYVNKPGQEGVFVANYTVGVLLFNMPISKYSIRNDYYECIFPSDRSLLQEGTSAPVSYVYATEKLPMPDGSFIRVVVAPIIRMLNSTITMGATKNNYFKFYLPILSNGTSPYSSQSVTLTGKDVSVMTEDSVNSVLIKISFPRINDGFDRFFFNFKEGEEGGNVEKVVDVPDGSIIEFYTSEVRVSLGL